MSRDTWPAAANATTAPILPPHAPGLEPLTDPALTGRDIDIPDVTPDTLGLADDRIAQVLHLSALLGKAIQALTPAERDELTRNYAWPTRVMRAAGVGRVA